MNEVDREAISQALKDTLSFEPTALERVYEELLRIAQVAEPGDVAETLSGEAPEATIVECASQFTRAVGQEKSAEALESAWHRLGEPERLSIAMTAGSGNAFADEVWLRLFENPSNTVHERHRIAAGLATSPNEKTRALIPYLVKRIGKYPDTERQAILEQFASNFG